MVFVTFLECQEADMQVQDLICSLMRHIQNYKIWKISHKHVASMIIVLYQLSSGVASKVSRFLVTYTLTDFYYPRESGI